MNKYVEWAKAGLSLDEMIVREINENSYLENMDDITLYWLKFKIIDTLTKSFNLEPNEKIYNIIVDYYDKNIINGKKYLVITGTRVGCEYTDFKLIDKAFDMATINNVDSIIHLGDMMAGQYKTEFMPIDERYKLFNKEYPKIDIPQYLVVGDEDSSCCDLDEEEPNIDCNKSADLGLDEVCVNKNIKILGEIRSYANLNNENCRAYLYHNGYSAYNIPELDFDILFAVKDHRCKIKTSNKVVVPELCLSYGLQNAGFVILTMHDKKFIDELYNFDNNYKVNKTKEKILKRKKY